MLHALNWCWLFHKMKNNLFLELHKNENNLKILFYLPVFKNMYL